MEHQKPVCWFVILALSLQSMDNGEIQKPFLVMISLSGILRIHMVQYSTCRSKECARGKSYVLNSDMVCLDVCLCFMSVAVIVYTQYI